MPKQDILERFIFEQAPIRGEYIHLYESFLTIAQQHSYPPLLRQLLGEALCVVGLLSAVLKFNGRLTLQFRGKGKLKLLLVQCDNHFHLRGLIKWEEEISSLAGLMAAFNEGVLAIMIDTGPNNARYQGIVSWHGNSLAESIENYFRNSEQLATKIWLTVDESSASGFLLQVIPTADTNAIGIEKEIINPQWAHIMQLTTKLSSDDLLHIEYPSLLKILYPEEDIRVFPSTNVSFGCTCSRKRSVDAIVILGKEDAEAELRDKQNIVVTCDFCNKEYIFDRVDVEKIFKDKNVPPEDIYLH